jgi:hypothetical protein
MATGVVSSEMKIDETYMETILDHRFLYFWDACHAEAAFFKRSTKVFEDVLAAGGDGLRVLGLHGAVPVEGGIPLLIRPQHCRCHRGFGRDCPAGRPVRQGRRGRF